VTLVRLHAEAEPPVLAEIAARWFSAGATGLEERPGGLSVYAEQGPELERLSDALAGLPLETLERHAVDPSWQEAWLAALGPRQVTERLTFRPTHAAPAPAGESTLWFAPRASFGAGDHATTRLTARALERLGEAEPDLRLLDVGCGSGVLSLVALKSGFSSALLLDVEQEAVDSAQANAALNGLAAQAEVRRGSAGDVTGSFPVIAANILLPVLLELADALAARLAPGGRLLLSGVLEEQLPELLARYGSLGLEVYEIERESGWALACLRASK
jgi:ribosomal protein L11 methyltransferase